MTSPNMTLCPECRDGKHLACDDTSWDDMTDEPCPCLCAVRGHQE